MEPKKIVSRSFLALFILAVTVNIVQIIIQLLGTKYAPKIVNSDWYQWALTVVSFIIVGFPVYYFIIRKIPDTPKKEIVRIKPAHFIMFFFICVAVMYITNFFTQIIVVFVTFIKGGELINPAAEAIFNGNFTVTLIYVSVIAPIYEEVIFRKLLLNKLRRFGDVPAILMTGFAFGLFHFNLLQFFYATTLGFLFAYITIRTNTILYSVILHMMINFISTGITPFVLNKNIIAMMLTALWVMVSITIGVIFFILNIRKIKLEKSEPLMKFSSYFLNPGALLFGAVSIALFTVATIVSK